jgi:hypothetical protein
MRIVVRGAVAASVVAVLSGCGVTPGSEPPGAKSGDCTARLGYAEVVYSPNSNLKPFAPPGKSLGLGTEVDCDGSALDRRVPVHAIRGIAPRKAIIVTGRGGMRGTYINEHLRRSEWPNALRRN